MKNKRAEHLPEYWKNWVENHPQLSQGLSVEDFNGSKVQVRLEDHSFMCFNYAFIVEGEEDFVIFTEHCGYFCFKKSQCLDFRTVKCRS